MSELTFTKSFLTNLDSKPQKYPPNHIFAPGSFSPRSPYTLPRLPHPPYPLPPQTGATAPPPPGSTRSDVVTIMLKSSRNPPLSVTFKDVSAGDTTITSLKEAVKKELESQNMTVDVSKVKILYNKKPIPASKANLAEVLEGEKVPKEVELGVMILGGVTSTSAAGTAAATDPMEGVEKAAPAQGAIGEDVLGTAEFWNDLQGFLEQRLKDEVEAEKLRGLFKEAWETAMEKVRSP